MRYEQLLSGIEYTGVAPAGQAELIVQDSRKVAPGAVFVCIVGRSSDGHDYAAKAVADGAGMVVTQRPLGLPCEVLVADTRAAYAAMCANYFGHPADKLVMVAVTGTNGKTTVSTVLRQVLEAAGMRCGLIGTAGSEVGAVHIPAKFTTPEAWDLNALLARMVKAGCTHAVMEASSQALEQGRLCGVRFQLGIFTNLTRDHLDYHGDMEQYFAAKKLLFGACDTMLVNAADPWGHRLLQEMPAVPAQTFAVEGEADFVARETSLQPGSVQFTLCAQAGTYRVRFAMPGGYSIENALAVLGAAVMLGLAPARAAECLAQSRGVPGRCEVLYDGDCTVIRDFAHTGDALEKLLAALRPFVRGRLHVLYGCAGNRDAQKRLVMSEAAVKYGDVIYLTNDNSREEPPDKIFDEALPPLRAGGKPYEVILDREAAVRRALAALQEQDMLVLCGKGHEDYQVLDGVTVFLDEAQIVQEWLCAK